MPEADEPIESKKVNVRVTISSLGNERRVVNFGECDEEHVDKILQTIQSAFDKIRKSESLTLVGMDGVTVFANLDNIAFVEVHIG